MKLHILGRSNNNGELTLTEEAKKEMAEFMRTRKNVNFSIDIEELTEYGTIAGMFGYYMKILAPKLYELSRQNGNEHYTFERFEYILREGCIITNKGGGEVLEPQKLNYEQWKKYLEYCKLLSAEMFNHAIE